MFTDSLCQLCLGAGPYGSQISERDSFRLLGRYAEAGGNFIDTAHVYGAWDKSGANGGAGNSEVVLGRWLKANKNRSQMYIGTKGAHPDFETKASRLNEADVHRELNESLDRLQTDYVDIYWLHRDDRHLPVSEILGWLSAPLQDGRIRAIGVSNWRADRLAEAIKLKPGIAASQIAWSLAASNWPRREGPYGEEIACAEADRAFHQTSQLPLVAYTAQAGGVFAAKYDGLSLTDSDFPKAGLSARFGNPLTEKRRQIAQDLAQTHRCSSNQIALAYLLHQPFPVYAIVGPGTRAQLDDALGARAVTLSQTEMHRLETGASA